ncbi:hypothetical protein BHE74_00038492, partial [Ensete ventricosum]
EQFYPWAPLVAIEDSTIGDLYVELVTIFDLKCHTCSNLAIEEVIGVGCIYKNGDGLLFKESSNFHNRRVIVTGHLFLCGFIFKFEVFFRWYDILILYGFDDEEPPLFAAMFLALRFITMPTQPLADCSRSSSLVNFFGAETRMAVEGAEGFAMASWEVTLVLCTSWFIHSSRILAKELAAIRVYGCRTFTSS